MRLVLVFALTLFSSLGLSQEGSSEMANEETGIEELEANRAQRTQRLEMITEIGEGGSGELTLTPEEQLKKMGYGNLNPASLMSLEALNSMEKVLKEARMWEAPPELVKEQVIKAFAGTAIGGYVQKSPRLINFFVDFLRDEKALLSGIKIFKDRQRLKLYLYFWIGIMFAAYYLKRLFVSKYWSGPAKAIAAALYSCTVTVITMSTFCLIFDEEMKPILTVIHRHL